jgi:type II secretory pathway component GspD/PulD (secretin)
MCLCYHAVSAQDSFPSTGPQRVVTIKPNYLPPSELLDFLGLEGSGGHTSMIWRTADARTEVRVRHNQAANLIVLSGPADAVAHAEELIRQADTPPRQIEIEVQIVEISTNKARDIGLDWERALNTGNPRIYGSYRKSKDSYYSRRTINDVAHSDDRFASTTDRDGSLTGYVHLDELINILDSTGVGTVRNAPRILTLNNRRATILDGQRVTYVTRYSSYTNMYQTDSMDAGLTLSVLPSLGESGYITMDISAELTSLDRDRMFSGSPVKDGQMVDNTVIVKEGQSVLLGGLNRSVEKESQKRFPVLGHILPFLFSRHVKTTSEIRSYVVLTPRVIDFGGNLDEETRREIEGG